MTGEQFLGGQAGAVGLWECRVYVSGLMLGRKLVVDRNGRVGSSAKPSL